MSGTVEWPILTKTIELSLNQEPGIEDDASLMGVCLEMDVAAVCVCVCVPAAGES